MSKKRNILRAQASTELQSAEPPRLVTTIEFSGTYDAQRGVVTSFTMSLSDVDPAIVLRLGQSIEAQAFALVVNEWNAARQYAAALEAKIAKLNK